MSCLDPAVPIIIPLACKFRASRAQARGLGPRRRWNQRATEHYYVRASPQISQRPAKGLGHRHSKLCAQHSDTTYLFKKYCKNGSIFCSMTICRQCAQAATIRFAPHGRLTCCTAVLHAAHDTHMSHTIEAYQERLTSNCTKCICITLT